MGRSRWARAALAVGAAMWLASCGGGTSARPQMTQPSSHPAPATTVALPQHAVETIYRTLPSMDEDSESPPIRYDVVSAGPRRLRVDLQAYSDPAMTQPDERLTYTWDGVRLLTYDDGRDPRYILYDAPREHPDTWAEVSEWLSPPPAALPGRSCSRLPGTRSILGRTAVGYSCRYAGTPDSDAFTDKQWVDGKTGVPLEQEGIQVERLAENAHVDAVTFSTRPPTGAAATEVPARKPPAGQSGRAPDFALDRPGGGQIRSADLMGKPFVLAFFASDLAFGDAPESLRILQRLTHDGTRPTVIGVQVGDRLGKPGVAPPVPRGLRLPIGYDDQGVLQNRFGIANQVGFAFVRSDGSISATYEGEATRAELARSLAQLR